MGSKILNFAVLGLILVGIPFTVYIAQKRQEIRQRAQDSIKADLDIAYIERSPRYYRYCVEYVNDFPSLCSGTENNKRWPDNGETVTYKAHILTKKNASGNLSSGSAPFNYQWLVDGNIVSSGESSVQSNSETILEYQTAWQSTPQSVQFKVLTDSRLDGDLSINNSLTVGSHDLTLSIWAEKGIYDIFNNTKNLSGTYSFEDWIEAHFAKMNERFSQARYTNISPDGVKDRVRIDKIVVADELDGASSPMKSDPDQYLIDGRWQFTDGDETNNNGRNGNWQQYVNEYVNSIDWGLNHELTHQLGIIDLYRMNLPNDPDNNNRIQIRDQKGNIIPYSSLPTFAWGQVIFENPGIMGGGDTSPHKVDTFFESHTAAGLNSNYGKRRGFYGEYLYDTPANTSIKILDKSGNIIPGAQVKLYQKDDKNNEIFDNTPEITGTTNTQGILSLLNKNVSGGTTATGHTLRPNPFGKINVVGTNGTMIAQVIKDGVEGYGFLTIHDLNIAYWLGNRESALITVKTNTDIFTPPTATLIPTLTLTITPTVTITVSPSIAPSIRPSVSPSVSPSISITPSREITPTGKIGGTLLDLELKLMAIGKDKGKSENDNPGNKTRQVLVRIFKSAQNDPIATETTNITYNSSSGTFMGAADLGDVVEEIGDYAFEVETGKYLRKIVGKDTNRIIQHIVKGTRKTAPLTTLVIGDINNDNVLNIEDWNIWDACRNKTMNTPVPLNGVSGNCDITDLNDDGEVDHTTGSLNMRDYQWLFNSFQVQTGD